MENSQKFVIFFNKMTCILSIPTIFSLNFFKDKLLFFVQFFVQILIKQSPFNSELVAQTCNHFGVSTIFAVLYIFFAVSRHLR